MKICIVDDHRLFREGLKFLLAALEDAEIYESDSAEELLKILPGIKPDIVLMDIEMPGMGGIEGTRRVLEQQPCCKVLALSMHANENFYSQMIDAGAKGFLVKNSKIEDVQNAIQEVAAGNSYFSPEILNAIIKNLHRKPAHEPNKALSDREIEVIYKICKGLSNQEIAQELFISKRTVDKHRENILLKTESRNTAELVVYAIKNGVFEV
jgi:two-component system, NarL family, response regulator LiaR